jgi:hypothetical protein
MLEAFIQSRRVSPVESCPQGFSSDGGNTDISKLRDKGRQGSDTVTLVGELQQSNRRLNETARSWQRYRHEDSASPIENPSLDAIKYVQKESHCMTIIPAPFLFRYTLPVVRIDRLPRTKSPLINLPAQCRLPWPSSMEKSPEFAKLAMAWNPGGIAIEVTVTGKTQKPFAIPEAIPSSDAVHIFVDTRDTQSQHRGSRFCHYFVAMPTGGGDDGLQPCARQLPVARAREDAPEVDIESLLVETTVLEDGYRLAVWFPEEALHGFDTTSQRRLGFMLAINDTELGTQTLTVGTEFPFEADPSLWVSLELADGKPSA